MNILPRDFYAARYRFLSRILETLPNVKRISDDKLRITEYIDGKRRFKEYSSFRPEYKYLSESEVKRREIFEKIKELESLYLTQFNTSIKEDSQHIRPGGGGTVSAQFCSELEHQSCPLENPNAYVFDGTHFRSRGELMVASALKDFGLEYRYDSGIVLNGKTYYTDFAIPLPELGTGWFLEYLGRLDDRKYVNHNSEKIRDYINSGIYPGRDLLLIPGNEKYTPGMDVIKTLISGFIEVQCTMYLKKK